MSSNVSGAIATHSNIDTRKIKAIQFGILSPDVIVKTFHIIILFNFL